MGFLTRQAFKKSLASFEIPLGILGNTHTLPITHKSSSESNSSSLSQGDFPVSISHTTHPKAQKSDFGSCTLSITVSGATANFHGGVVAVNLVSLSLSKTGSLSLSLSKFRDFRDLGIWLSGTTTSFRLMFFFFFLFLFSF